MKALNRHRNWQERNERNKLFLSINTRNVRKRDTTVRDFVILYKHSVCNEFFSGCGLSQKKHTSYLNPSSMKHFFKADKGCFAFVFSFRSIWYEQGKLICIPRVRTTSVSLLQTDACGTFSDISYLLMIFVVIWSWYSHMSSFAIFPK